MSVPVTFGDFKPNELSKLINNKDPLGLNEDIESYFTNEGSNSKATISEASEPRASSMEYDAIPHYLKMMSSMVSLNNQEMCILIQISSKIPTTTLTLKQKRVKKTLYLFLSKLLALLLVIYPEKFHSKASKQSRNLARDLLPTLAAITQVNMDI